VDEDEKGPCILHSEVEKAFEELLLMMMTMTMLTTTTMYRYLEMYSNCWEKMVSK
jgi:hypothetical protein